MKKEEKYKLILGRHISLAKIEIEEILPIIKDLRINSLMLYLNRGEKIKDNSKLEKFRKIFEEKIIEEKNLFLHISYFVNLANTEKKNLYQQSINNLKKEIIRGDKLGIKKIILHPGSAKGKNREECLKQLSVGLKEILKTFPEITISLETMCKKGDTIGSNFSEINEIIKMTDYHERLGVCLDTCHIYASGYDIKNKLNEVIEEFDKKISLKRLFVIHLNDSKGKLGSNLDRHENIGRGEIGKEALKKIVWNDKFNGIAKILETPTGNNQLNKQEISELKKD